MGKVPQDIAFDPPGNGDTPLSLHGWHAAALPGATRAEETKLNAGACFVRGAPSLKDENAKDADNGDQKAKARSGTAGRERSVPQYPSPGTRPSGRWFHRIIVEMFFFLFFGLFDFLLV